MNKVDYNNNLEIVHKINQLLYINLELIQLTNDNEPLQNLISTQYDIFHIIEQIYVTKLEISIEKKPCADTLEDML